MARSFALPVDMASTNSRPRAKGWIAVIGITAIVIGITAIGILALDFVMNTQVPMQEVGATSEYSQLLGKTFRTREDLRMFGITADRHYAPQVDYFVLVGRIGFDGREIITRDRLRKGTVIKVVGVLGGGLQSHSYAAQDMSCKRPKVES